MAVKVLVVDDHEVVRSGLASLLSGSNVKIVAEAGTNSEATKMASKHKPDVILLDIRLPDGDSIDSMPKLRKAAPDAAVVMLSTYDNPTYVARAITAGADEYMLKGSSRQDLIAAIQSAASGKGYTPGGQMGRVAESMSKRSTVEVDDGAVTLTNRETQVLRHIALGLSNKEIARALEISIETVKEHVQNLLRKIAVADRTQAAVWAMKKKLV